MLMHADAFWMLCTTIVHTSGHVIPGLYCYMDKGRWGLYGCLQEGNFVVYLVFWVQLASNALVAAAYLC